MTYWFTDSALKNLLPLSGASVIQGLSVVFSVPKLFMGPNALSDVRGMGTNILNSLRAMCAKKHAYVITDEHAVRYANRVCSAMVRRGFTTEVWDKGQSEAPLEMSKSAPNQCNNLNRIS